MISRTIGRYRVVDKLGEGGMGTVWKAEDPLLGRAVALKVLAPDLAQSEDARRRFLREARATSMLNHPGICAVYDAGESDGHAFIALELIVGQTLSAIAERVPLPIADVVRLGITVGEALGFAHAHGVIHRDVTGRNIMLARDGRVFVLDFGVALAVGLSRVTRSGVQVGTLAYLSPEATRGEGVDARSDLYGLGVVLYEALTGTLPFEGDRVESLVYAIVHLPPAPLVARRRDVPPALEAVILRLLAKDPAQRHSDAEALIADLRSISEAPMPAVRAQPWSDGPAPAGSPDRRRYLAVLPFDVEEDDRLLSIGLVDVLSAALARTPGLHVVPVSLASSEDISNDLQHTARQLGANLFVRGSIRRVGAHVRVGWEIVDPARGIRVAGDTVEGHASDNFRLEDRLVAVVLNALGFEPPRTARPAVEDPAARERLLQAIGYLQRYDHEASIDGAIDILERLRAGEPENAEIEAALSRAYLYKYRLARDPRWESLAAAACERAMTLDAGAAEVLVTLGDLGVATDQHERAVRAYSQALELDPDRPEALTGLGRALQGAGRLEEAERVFRRAIELRPQYWGAHMALGRFLRRVGRYEEALASFQHVVRLSPDNSAGWLNHVAPLFELERFDEALEACRRSIEIRPLPGPLATLGSLLFYLGRYEEALVAFERAVTLGPEDCRTWGDLGSACRFVPGQEQRMNEALDRAIAIARKHLDRHPTDAYHWSMLAGWLVNFGRRSEAIRAIEQTLSLNPDNPDYMARACAIYYQAGERERSLEWLVRARSHGYRMTRLLRDPYLAGMREDREFARIVSGEPRSGEQQESPTQT